MKSARVCWALFLCINDGGQGQTRQDRHRRLRRRRHLLWGQTVPSRSRRAFSAPLRLRGCSRKRRTNPKPKRRFSYPPSRRPVAGGNRPVRSCHRRLEVHGEPLPRRTADAAGRQAYRPADTPKRLGQRGCTGGTVPGSACLRRHVLCLPQPHRARRHPSHRPRQDRPRPPRWFTG